MVHVNAISISSISLTCSVRHVPRLRRSTINVVGVESRRVEIIPGRLGVDRRVTGIDNALPSIVNLVNAAVAEVGIPFLLNKCLWPGVHAWRSNRDHVNALDRFDVAAEERCVMDLVLENNTSDLVPDKILRLLYVVGSVKIVLAQSPCLDSQLKVRSVKSRR